MTKTEQARLRIKGWRENPCLFVQENFGVDPDKWQERALNAFASDDEDKKRISMQACAGPGKSAVLAWCGWNFLSCYGEKGEHPKGAAVSVTESNLKDNLWSEFAKWQQRSEFLKQAYEWNAQRISNKLFKNTWFLSARSFAKTANTEEVGRTLSGLHAKYILYLIDESGDIPPTIVKSAEQGLSTGPAFGKILQAGNPTSLQGMLYAAATKLRHQWYVIRITGDPDDLERSSRIDIDWARDQIKLYGRDDPWVKPYILGMFPESSINNLITIEQVEAAMDRHYGPEKYSFAQKRLGVDVALEGDDMTVLAPRQGIVAFNMIAMRTQEPADISARMAAAKLKWNQELDFVDNTGGFGSGVVSHYKMAGHSPIAVNFASKAIKRNIYYNKRAEMWWEMCQWVKDGGALPRCPELVAELTTPTYTHKGGRILIEPKAKVKERLLRSPDRADALCLTFAMPDMPAAATRLPGSAQNQNYVSDYDPFADNRT